MFTIRHMACAICCVFAAGAHAATITDNIGLVNVNFLTGANTTLPAPGFDPALGTLTSIDLSYSATATLLQGDALSSRIRIYLGSDLLSQINFPSMTGRAQQTESGTFTVSAVDLPGFETPGTVDLTLTPFTACRGTAPTPSGCNAFTANLTGAVTYTYNPPAASATAPEPPSFLLLGAALVGAGMLRRSAKPGATMFHAQIASDCRAVLRLHDGRHHATRCGPAACP